MMTWGAVYWPVWLVLAFLVTFLGPEIFALATNPANTLSDWVWMVLQVKPDEKWSAHSAGWLLSLGVYITVAVWLGWHFWGRDFT